MILCRSAVGCNNDERLNLAVCDEVIHNSVNSGYNLVNQRIKLIVAAAIAKVNEELEVKKAELEEKLSEAIAAAEEEAAIKKAELEVLYNEKVAEIEAELNAITEQIKAEVEAKYAELSNAYNAKLAELEAKKAELEAQLEQLKAELAEAADEVAAEIQVKIDEVNNTIAEVTAEINAVVAQIESAYNQAVAEVEAIYAQTVETLKNAIEEARAEFDNAVAEVEEKLTTALEELKVETQKQLDVVIEATNNAIAALEELAGGLHDELDAYLEELNAEIVKAEAALKEIIAGSKEAAGELIDAVEAIVADGKASLSFFGNCFAEICKSVGNSFIECVNIANQLSDHNVNIVNHDISHIHSLFQSLGNVDSCFTSCVKCSNEFFCSLFQIGIVQNIVYIFNHVLQCYSGISYIVKYITELLNCINNAVCEPCDFDDFVFNVLDKRLNIFDCSLYSAITFSSSALAVSKASRAASVWLAISCSSSVFLASSSAYKASS